MIIHQPVFNLSEKSVCLSAKVHIDNKQKTYPNELWFRYPKIYSNQLTKSSNPFASSLFLLAGFLGEGLNIKGALSPRLLWGMKEYLNTFNVWFPNSYSQIKIDCDSLLESKTNNTTKTAMAFSGGVDSFFTLLRNTPDKTKILPISFAIFLHGFDIPLKDTESYETAVANYEPVLNSFSVEMIPVATNVRDFTGDLNWNHIYGSIIRRGVAIGNGAVIGANSYVNHDVPDFAVVAGSPARIIKYRFSSEISEAIKESKWWDYELEKSRDIINKIENRYPCLFRS